MRTGFGYGNGKDWYPCCCGESLTRKSAEVECKTQLGHLTGVLYTQRWIAILSIPFRVPLTKKTLKIEE